jgi:hypothetical protein
MLDLSYINLAPAPALHPDARCKRCIHCMRRLFVAKVPDERCKALQPHRQIPECGDFRLNLIGRSVAAAGGGSQTGGGHGCWRCTVADAHVHHSPEKSSPPSGSTNVSCIETTVPNLKGETSEALNSAGTKLPARDK